MLDVFSLGFFCFVEILAFEIYKDGMNGKEISTEIQTILPKHFSKCEYLVEKTRQTLKCSLFLAINSVI